MPIPTNNPEGKDPVQPKSELMVLLDESIKACRAFCDQHEIDLQALLDADTTFSKLERFNDYADLVQFAEDLRQEDERHIRLGLEKEELELCDLLKKDKLTKAEEQAVKNAARHLLKRLKEEQPRVLVQDWYRDTQSRQHVKSAIEEVLDKDLPEDSYGRKAYKEVCDRIYEHIFVQASRGEGWMAA